MTKKDKKLKICKKHTIQGKFNLPEKFIVQYPSTSGCPVCALEGDIKNLRQEVQNLYYELREENCR